MLEKILRTTEKIIPKKIYKLGQPVYHYLLAMIGAVKFNFPSRKLKIVGVTGTKGKTSTTEVISKILEEAGYKVALANSIRFKVGEESKRNTYKMSMPGRFFMQSFLQKALSNNCDWVVLEITSEGAKQFRHKWIYLDALIFTNLAPEHIESHGSFEKYKEAKLSIAETLDFTKTDNKKETYLIVNKDDKHSNSFLEKTAKHKIEYETKNSFIETEENNVGYKVRLNNSEENSFIFPKLHGSFNSYNIAAAISFAKAFNIGEEIIKKAVESLNKIPGRAELIVKNPETYVDYAHTPDSLEALYSSFKDKNKVCVLGNTGGGRDTWKRPEMAKIASTHCNQIILTDEDPYDEDPEKIIDEMKVAIDNPNLEIILDRREAINKAIKLGKENENSVVLITGKGTDPYIMRANGEKEPWSDAEVVKEEFAKIK